MGFVIYLNLDNGLQRLCEENAEQTFQLPSLHDEMKLEVFLKGYDKKPLEEIEAFFKTKP